MTYKLQRFQNVFASSTQIIGLVLTEGESKIKGSFLNEITTQ